ncbi:hypothetical protein O159_24320 [Leifsonia xyli subsp. cynodontis DSM 46306]|jgi:hypothetical protein|uniref:Uncharacterized protein n=1 Tax=Leifsonia xyli subsp. cynodontis DSM 46306 TaxID=1389489 RepID=U3PFH5_LEIXC|nr:hypothetical protein [Leifsonia xyli]AGW42378.1 hypothetical protein O159_24320 [Leifsonia xyli subsp. cynodontis DSM 46306]
MHFWRPLELVDVGLGFVGFFGFAFFVVTAVCELTGQPALGWALTTLTLAVAFIALLQARRRITTTRLPAQSRPERDA